MPTNIGDGAATATGSGTRVTATNGAQGFAPPPSSSPTSLGLEGSSSPPSPPSPSSPSSPASLSASPAPASVPLPGIIGGITAVLAVVIALVALRRHRRKNKDNGVPKFMEEMESAYYAGGGGGDEKQPYNPKSTIPYRAVSASGNHSPPPPPGGPPLETTRTSHSSNRNPFGDDYSDTASASGGAGGTFHQPVYTYQNTSHNATPLYTIRPTSAGGGDVSSGSGSGTYSWGSPPQEPPPSITSSNITVRAQRGKNPGGAGGYPGTRGAVRQQPTDPFTGPFDEYVQSPPAGATRVSPRTSLDHARRTSLDNARRTSLEGYAREVYTGRASLEHPVWPPVEHVARRPSIGSTAAVGVGGAAAGLGAAMRRQSSIGHDSALGRSVGGHVREYSTGQDTITASRMSPDSGKRSRRRSRVLAEAEQRARSRSGKRGSKYGGDAVEEQEQHEQEQERMVVEKAPVQTEQTRSQTKSKRASRVNTDDNGTTEKGSRSSKRASKIPPAVAQALLEPERDPEPNPRPPSASTTDSKRILHSIPITDEPETPRATAAGRTFPPPSTRRGSHPGADVEFMNSRPLSEVSTSTPSFVTAASDQGGFDFPRSPELAPTPAAVPFGDEMVELDWVDDEEGWGRRTVQQPPTRRLSRERKVPQMR
ncbi:hypothetical protein M427DRAFT_154672 [Gonapodya prolifera JEL478]|uniref:Uncharacterized protein n=1 Tax=Gonapodya prolifera (strain JEL478) TaxID=1344416 RepID=A0A139AIT8_GONPJ|nr:hypothetical protein M427DRAFT_154672 [Gonapodya prolifera JEL478]|eukprot:KXS16363.1 hypothetical protein M427DRAFT_154672 [Gonapodya prolifera JEL478]